MVLCVPWADAAELRVPTAAEPREPRWPLELLGGSQRIYSFAASLVAAGELHRGRKPTSLFTAGCPSRTAWGWYVQWMLVGETNGWMNEGTERAAGAAELQLCAQAR